MVKKKVVKKSEPKTAEPKITKPKCKCSEKFFIYLSIALGILLIAAIIFAIIGFTNKNSDASVSEEEMSKIVLNLLEKQGIEAKLVNSGSESGLYKFSFEVQGKTGYIYATKDGIYLIENPIPIKALEEYLKTLGNEAEEEKVELKKSENPELKVYLSPYCPYGLQYLKALIPVYEHLKSNADISIQFFGTTHMTTEELPEIKRELCIVDEYGQDKLFAYLKEIVYGEEGAECYNVYHGVNLMTNEAIDSEYRGDGAHFTNCMAPIIDNAIEKANLDKSKIDECITTKSDTLYLEAANNKPSNINASPTAKINGASMNTNRTPEAIKDGICEAFLEAPEACNKELSNEVLTPGIGDKTSTGASVGVC